MYLVGRMPCLTIPPPLYFILVIPPPIIFFLGLSIPPPIIFFGLLRLASKASSLISGPFPSLRKRIFNRIKAGGKGGRPGQWSARKAQMMAKAYKKAGGGYTN